MTKYHQEQETKNENETDDEPTASIRFMHLVVCIAKYLSSTTSTTSGNSGNIIQGLIKQVITDMAASMNAN